MTRKNMSLIALIIFIGAGAGAQAGEPGKASLAFVTYLQWDSQEYSAAMLVNSIRRWGGEYAGCPIYVVLADAERTGFRLKDKNVTFVPLTLSDAVRYYPFATKAFAAAKVEELTAGKVGTLVWLDPETIILGPPKEYDLKKGFAAAVAPVTLINTGQAENEPVDAYWGPIYKRCGLELKKIFPVETFVDCKKVRAWLNCGMFSVRPERGLFREWAKILDEFVNDREYQRTAITDGIHRTFLHQAVISTLIVSRLERREIHMLSRGYNYPLFCHDLDFTTLTGGVYKVPPHKKANKLNDLTSVFIESLFAEHADWIKFIPPADEPLKTWLLQEYYDSLRVVDHIYREENSCNSYLITTDGGSVLVDPGGAAAPESALRHLSRKSPVQAILLTHGHHDHIDGIAGWTKDKDVPVIAQRGIVEFIDHNDRLSGFNSRRLAIQSGTPLPERADEKAATPMPATVLFDKSHSVEYGGIHFELFHTGGETPDQCVIWIPELKAVFIGDNYYSSFPNLSTLRGSPPRPALEYTKALEKALSLEPEVLLPGHGDPLLGRDNVRRKLTKYRDAVRYVHDATVKGMNEGKDARTLAQEISLPPELQLPQAFGRVSWAVRGIFDAYAGWFDENPSSMYKLPPSSIDSELVRLCGGTDVLARRALELAQNGDDVRALHMTDVALAVDPNHKPTLEARLIALKSLLAKSGNSIEANWLRYGIRTAEAKLKGN
jgi:glyoxylase-like metal-dependent hydrolase (beta-lactamase superfamily II)